jgi:MYXO-CTERM domain-containing protein
MRLSSLLLLASSIATLAGCTANEQTASLQDEFGLDGIASAIGNQNGMSSPYVQGSKFTVTVQAGSKATASGWKLQSSDPGVMQVGGMTSSSTTSQVYPVVATGAGTTTLTVTDANGKVLDSEDIEVDEASSYQLCDQGLLMSGASDDRSAVTQIHLLAGGTATFLVRYFNGTKELSGNNALVPTGGTGVTASTVATSFSARDFLEVSALDAGTASVSLAVGSTSNVVPITIVDDTAIHSVGLAAQTETGAKDGQSLYVFGRAFDVDGNEVFGGSFQWTAGGAAVSVPVYDDGKPSDVIVYQYDHTQAESVSASLDSQSASIQVHGSPSTTTAATSENVGCSVANGPGAPGSVAAGVLVGLALLASRRRNRC